MQFDFTQITLDPVGIAFIIAAMWVVLKDLGILATRKGREEKRKSCERNKQLDIMLNDWTGTEARPGYNKVPSVPERLQTIEGHLKVIDKELNFNSGSTTKDAVYRMDKSLTQLTEAFEAQRR